MEKNFVQSLVNMRDDRVTFRKNDGRSDVWDSFLKVEIDACFSGYVMCIKCSTILKWKSSDGTSGLRTHKTTCKAGSEKTSEPVDMHFVTTTTFKKSLDASEISVASLERDAITEEIVRMCARDLVPLKVVGGEGFQELATKLMSFGALYGPIDAPTILPSESSLRRHLQFTAEEGRCKLAEVLQRISKFSVAVDFWNHKTFFETFVTVKVNYIDDDWNLCSPILMTKAIDKDQSPTDIRLLITEILQRFNAHRYDNTFITDDVIKLKSAFEDSTWLCCCCHSIDVIISQALDIESNSSLNCITSLISTCNNIVLHAIRSRYFKRLDVQLRKAIGGHWISILEMLKSINANIVQLKNISAEIKDKGLEILLENLNETLLQDVIKVLEVFQQASHLLSSGEGPTIHLVVATKCKLIKCTQPSSSNSDVIITLKKKMLELINCHFVIHRMCYIALLLDPRLKNNKTVWTNEDKDSAVQQLRDLLKVKVEFTMKDECKNNFESNFTGIDSPSEPQSKKMKVDFLDEIFMEASKPTVDEVDEYMNNRSTGEDVLRFWRDNERRFPNLSRTARVILATPAAKGPTRDPLYDRRVDLSPDRVDDLLFLHKSRIC